MISTISAYQISAETFFTLLRQRRVELLLDTRLKNESQLCGFTKKKDLAYLTRAVCGADYVHDPFFTPEPAALERYLKRQAGWEEYSAVYLSGLEKNGAGRYFLERYGLYDSVCLLGTATKSRRSHVEVLERYLRRHTDG